MHFFISLRFCSRLAYSSASTCLLKVALFSAQLEKYDAAIRIYEDIASQSVDNQLLRWSVKEYFLRAGMCHLCAVRCFLFSLFIY